MTMDTLETKIRKSKEVLQEALETYSGKIALAWTGGKDSTTTLHMLRDLGGGRVEIPILNIDTSVKFKEIYEFRDRLAREWDLNLVIACNKEALKNISIAENPEECCLKLKAEVIAASIMTYGWQALITGMRWDEQPDRVHEAYFSPRENPAHVRVHPILHFTEKDIWEYIRTYNVPYCSLYDQGYRSLGCAPCTQLGTPDGPERAGRNQSKEEIMEQLRNLGYF